MIIDALRRGADGVLTVGCHFGECHYEAGNYHADGRHWALRRILALLGISEDRVWFRQCSSAEGSKFAATVDEFNETIEGLGPLGAAEGLDRAELEDRLLLARDVVNGPKLRWVLGKAVEFQTKGNKYGEVWTRHEMNRCLEGVAQDELAVWRILRELGEEPKDVRRLSAACDLPPHRTLRYLEALRRRSVVRIERIEDDRPLFALSE